METVTAEMHQICRTIRMVEAEMQDGGDGSGREQQGIISLVMKSESYTLDYRSNG